MDRASDSGSEGWGCESLPAYQPEQSPLCSGLFFALGRKIGHPPAPLLLLTEKGHAHVACSLASALTTALAVYQLFSVKSTTRYLFFNKTHVVADYVSLATTF